MKNKKKTHRGVTLQIVPRKTVIKGSRGGCISWVKCITANTSDDWSVVSEAGSSPTSERAASLHFQTLCGQADRLSESESDSH